jgi:hypothetical protein
MKKYSSKPRGRVNQGGSTNEKDMVRFAKLGENYNSIDFHMNDAVTKSNYTKKDLPIGELQIGNRFVELTWSECSKLIETLQLAQLTHNQKIRLGVF